MDQEIDVGDKDGIVVIELKEGGVAETSRGVDVAYHL